uniref:Uncharacterized protein n=1 Tax=Caenorhabditis tropicalis TaxID=1561998 RepID=A0A1I7TEV5_9PELO
MELIDAKYTLNWFISIAILAVTIYVCGGKKKKKKTPPPVKKSISPVSKSPVMKEEKSRTPEAKTPETKTPEKEKEEVQKEEEPKENESKPKPPRYTEKELAIAAGAKKKKNEYPTMEDVISDWDDGKKDEKK